MSKKDVRIILFRCHAEPDIARERIKILRYFNPGTPIHVLFGGDKNEAGAYHDKLRSLVDSFWCYQIDRDKEWKWMHSDLMTKAWYRELGHQLSFDYLYSYEYDLLTLAPLGDIYPTVHYPEIALAAAEDFTKYIENRWGWTNEEPYRSRYVAFCQYLSDNYGIARQKTVCLGPGPLLSHEFLDKFSKTEDIDLVHEELTLPAYAEAFGISVKNNMMHPGFFKHSPDDAYFSCKQTAAVTKQDITDCLGSGNTRRAFHPVKDMITLDEVSSHSFGTIWV